MTNRIVATGDNPVNRRSICRSWDGAPLREAGDGASADTVEIICPSVTASITRVYGDDAHIVLPNSIIEQLLNDPHSGWVTLPFHAVENMAA